MPASYPLSIKTFLTYQDQPGTNNIIAPSDPTNPTPGTPYDLTIDRARITNDIHDEVISIEKAPAVGITGPQTTVIPGTTTMGSEIQALFTGKASGQVDPSNNAIYPSESGHNHVHNQLTGSDQNVHPQYMMVDGEPNLASGALCQSPAKTLQRRITLSLSVRTQGMGYITYPQGPVRDFHDGEAARPISNGRDHLHTIAAVPHDRWSSSGCYRLQWPDVDRLHPRPRFSGVLTVIYMKVPYPGPSVYGYTYQYEEDQLLLMAINNRRSLDSVHRGHRCGSSGVCRVGLDGSRGLSGRLRNRCLYPDPLRARSQFLVPVPTSRWTHS